MTTTLCYSPGSCSLAPHVVLQEIGEPFELRKFATAERANHSSEYLAINPKGRIPALQIDGFVLTETPAILAYLGRRFPSAGIYPADGSQAEAAPSSCGRWSNMAHVAYAQLMRPERFVPRERDHPPVRESGRTHYERCLAAIDETLQRQTCAVGDRFTVVDPFWLVFFRWGVRSAFDMRARYPAYTAYAERLGSRPSVRRALASEEISVWN